MVLLVQLSMGELELEVRLSRDDPGGYVAYSLMFWILSEAFQTALCRR